ncbi:MAG TPA: tetratricopeptide repeat protein [Polyangiaceae bacterium]|nr:tetratricopeptide repeat protein [Polyangiaceae bacterium]
MNVVELQHPEDLLDKLEAGSLAGAERERLDAHLAGCATCRMELAMRSDFAAEPPLAQPELPQLTVAKPEPERRPSSLSPRRGRRRQLSLLVIAAAWFASSALAATAAVSSVKVPWAMWFGHASTPAAAPSSRTAPRHVRSGHGTAARPSATPEADSTAEPPSDSAEAASSATSAPSADAPPDAPESVTAAPAHVKASHGGAASEAPSAELALPEPAASPDAAALLAEADGARRAGDGGRAIALYRELEQAYPSSPESGLSVALMARVLLDRGDAAGAEAAYQRYLQSGASALRAEALVGHARSLERLGRTGDAVAAWQEVERRLPGTVHARLAAERLTALSDR